MQIFSEIFDEVMTDCGLDAYVNEENRVSFGRLFGLLSEANEQLNLTAISDMHEVILRHFADSLTAAAFIPENSSVIDVGCGGGFPTLPLAIVRPDLKITSLDSTAKKLVFVKQSSEALGLSNITTISERAEEYSVGRERFDVAISRAVARMNLLSELCIPLVRVGGLFIAMKGAQGKEELEEASGGIKTLGGTVVKNEIFTLGSAGIRCVTVIEKTSHTPVAYPRAWAKIKKKPL